MFLRRLYDERLAQASYILGCQASGEALVVDPNRNVDQYLEMARRESLRVTHVTETHIHADFVSGARELAHRTGARLYLSGAGSSGWQYGYAGEAGAELLQDGSVIRVGGVELSVMHTPGHTPEHLAFIVTDAASARDPMGALTGDFLFVGDVGRPDLLEKAANERGTMVVGAHQLFGSLRRFGTLPDYLQIWPGHGAGSSCGKSLGAVPQSTLGYEKLANWAFVIEDEEEFVRAVLDGQPDPPRYFAMMKRINRDGPPLLGPARRPERLPGDRLARALADGAIVIDTRTAHDFAQGAVPGTINIPWNRSFTTWAGSMLPYDRDLYLIVDEASGAAVGAVAAELSGIGLDRVAGHFGVDVFDARRKGGEPLQTVPTIEAAALERNGAEVVVLDVRNAGEFMAGHLPVALNIPFGDLLGRVAEIPRDRPVVVHCLSGARAAIGASVLLAAGLRDVRVFPGGFAEWRASGRRVE
ncbi:MAG: MBL fold metallo-hydrolase [Gemmatimonadales bacterium]